LRGSCEAEGLALDGRPIGPEGAGRHAKNKDSGLLEPLIDLARDAIAGPNLPLVEPDPEAAVPQPFGKAAHDGLVFGTVAEKRVESKTVVGHDVTVLDPKKLYGDCWNDSNQALGARPLI